MPHSYKKEDEITYGRFINGDNMKTALTLVKQGTSIREAAKLTNLAYATVRRYWLKKQQNFHNNTSESQTKAKTMTIIHSTSGGKYDYNKIFSKKQECQLAEMCKGATIAQCRKLTYQMAVENNLKMDPIWHTDQLAGHEWFDNFQKRHHVTLVEDEIMLQDTSATIPKDIFQDCQNLSIKTEIIESNQSKKKKRTWNSSNDPDLSKIINTSDILFDDKKTLSSPQSPIHSTEIVENQTDESASSSSNKKMCDNLSDMNNITKNFQDGLMAVLNHIVSMNTKEKDTDELFLLSLLPALRKIKEEDKLKARIELIKVLDHF